MHYLHEQLAPFHATIGDPSILTDNTAKLLDITSPDTLHTVRHLTNNVILISPKLAVLTTNATSEQWSQCITQTWQQDPTNTPLKLKYRPSHPNKNKIYADIQATTEQQKAA